MKLTSLFSATLLATAIYAAAIPSDSTSLSLRDAGDFILELQPDGRLEKRKGGGGAKGGGSSSSSSSSHSGSSSSGSSSSGGRTSSSSSSGGRTSSGSGVKPAYGTRGSYYAGGASVPYTSGTRSPGGISPYYLAGPALIFPGLWLYGAYAYPYGRPYSFHNQSSGANNATNTTVPVQCLCEEYNECGCDNNTDTSYMSQIVGNGSASDLNTTVARYAQVNGTTTLVINGTLENGTTASGGTDSAASSLRQGLLESSGWWVVVGGVVYAVFF